MDQDRLFLLTVPGLMLALAAFLVGCRLLLGRGEFREVAQRQSYLPFVALSTLCGAVALAIQCLMSNAQLTATALMVGALYLTSSITLQYAMARRFAFVAPLAGSYAVMAIVLTGISYFSTIEDNLQLRMMLLNSGMAAISLMVVPQLLPILRSESLPQRLLALSYLLTGAMAVARLIGVSFLLSQDMLVEFTASPAWKAMLTLVLFFSLWFCAVCVLNIACEMVEVLQDQRDTDTLSGLANRGGFLNRVTRAIAAAPQERWFLVAADLDHFKRINDQCGHHMGDQVISGFGQLIKDLGSDMQVAGRIGGEEFMVLIAASSLKEAAAWADNLRCQLARLQILDQGVVTASFGVEQMMSAEDLPLAMRRVDALLYQAKARGRNCVVAGSSRSRSGADRSELPDLPILAGLTVAA